MIPIAYITEWKNVAPWADDAQVEQDLILSRVIVEIFNDPYLKQELAFRGGTALHKLFFSPAARYSEDIDLVRASKGPIGEIIDKLKAQLSPWLGNPQIIRTARSVKLRYSFMTEKLPASKARIKIEINIEESFSILDRLEKDFSVTSQWFTGFCQVNTFHFHELIATKLRALYQRKKGRDVFDLWLAINHNNFDPKAIVDIFLEYMKMNGEGIITQSLFEKNLDSKLHEPSFLYDIGILLSPELLQTHARPISSPDGILITAENGIHITTEGWSLADAAKEIKNQFLIWLPK